MRSVKHFVAGEFVDSANGKTFDSISPIDNEVRWPFIKTESKVFTFCFCRSKQRLSHNRNSCNRDANDGCLNAVASSHS